MSAENVETEEELFERRQCQLNRCLLAIEGCTLPDVRMKLEKDIRLLIATQMEEARVNHWTYSPPVIPGPRKPEIKFVYPTIVMEHGGDRELCNIVLTDNLPAWQGRLFCFFTGLQFTTAENAAYALLRTNWKSSLAVVREFRMTVSIQDLSAHVDLRNIFDNLDPIREVEGAQALEPLAAEFREYGDGMKFIIATSAEVSALIWKFADEHLIAFSRVNGFIGVFAGLDMQHMLRFLDGYFCGLFRSYVVVKKRKRCT